MCLVLVYLCLSEGDIEWALLFFTNIPWRQHLPRCISTRISHICRYILQAVLCRISLADLMNHAIVFLFCCTRSWMQQLVW